MDATATTFEDESFDYVIDKGTLDAIVLAPNGTVLAQRLMREVTRLLRKPTGAFVLISLGRPDMRLDLLEHDENGQPNGWYAERMLEIEIKNRRPEQELEFCYMYRVVRGTPPS
jgi:hypothetical protein